MRRHVFISVLTVSLVVGGLAVWGSASTAMGGDAVVATRIISVMPTLGDDYTYVGSKKCKKCHTKQHKSWAETRMGKALDILEPGSSKEAKEKFNLDASKDYTTDTACLKCHTTGFGHAGGYAVPNPDDKKSVRAAKARQGVGCESCHGPGSAYVKVFEEIMKSKREYTVDELYAVGLTKIEESTCLTCHNDESPTHAGAEPFDYEKRKEEGTHEHIPLKQRK